ncbi:asparagine synthase (glutamine-hydrolyzing) [Polynucleobacter paneuropaeus]|nr:asparagine synthase (glutamine-hydrolyzing) [Polynucleobacter paneuropaeus]
MCGIIGIASKTASYDRNLLVVGRDKLIHRGPDDAGVWWSKDGLIGFGHRRLAIFDLSPSGHQPMQDSAGACTIVFNGEIYNFQELRCELVGKGYSFHSSGDTEVILAAYHEWGVDCLSRFNGMFAFAIYDARRQTIFLARDRAGEKPLFYSLIDDTFRFASELKCFLSDPSFPHKINHQALDTYLAVGYVPGDMCMVKGVNKLPAAHAAIFDLSDRVLQVWKYWELPPPPVVKVDSEFDEHGLLKHFESLLEDAVRKQLSADVSVGVLLSGGVDSSLVTAMAVRSSDNVKTFTVGFDGFGRYDETKHARLIADFFGTEHIELNAGYVAPDLLETLAHQYDEPMADSSMIPTYLVSQLVRQHCTVALGGDGADELFGGYAHYDRLIWKQEKIDWAPMILRRMIARGSAMILPAGFKGRNWLQSLDCDLHRSLPLIATFFDGDMRRSLLGDKSWPLVGEKIWGSRCSMEGDLLQRMTRMDFVNYMVDDILVKVDRASMLNSLELRAPFLDYRIIEFAFGQVPSFMKATSKHRKIFLKKLAEKILPPEFDRQRKQGFSVPLASWLDAGPWRDFFNQVLFDEQSIFDKKTVARLFWSRDRGANNNERLFSLVLFELWRREYSMTL